MEKMELMWNYYKTQAENSGRAGKKGAQSGPYSIAWFYDSFNHGLLSKQLNPLTRAFLGDEGALDAIQRADDVQLRECRDDISAFFAGKEKAPNPLQTDAIANALLNRVTIIQGPPGTGKTETIKNFLLYLFKTAPTSAVAVVSSNTKAIDTIIEEVDQDETLRTKYAKLGNVFTRKKFCQDHQIILPSTRIMYNIKGEPEIVEDTSCSFPPELLQTYPIIFSTINSLNKCVCKTGTCGYYQFDYVIVDECSQVSNRLGILSAAAAQRLVLLGDSEQLPPVHTGSAESAVKGMEPYYLDRDDNSFMKACVARFGDRAGQIMLNEHYRCHPAIVEFCNRIAYDGKLITKTKDDGRLPIRVRWYEGDYWEYVPWGKKGRPANQEPGTQNAGKPDGRDKNFNEKQIQIFIKDECPYILNKFRGCGKYNEYFCVLSPYKDQLLHLKYEIEKSGALDGLPGQGVVDDDKATGGAKYTFSTIHKVQGGAFPLVYIMPVQDSGPHPWGQRKAFINVAVSRAREELCVITPAFWMPEEQLRKEYLDYVADAGHEIGPDCYLAKLLDYVCQAQKTRDTGDQFGFQKTSVRSVFDRSPYWRHGETHGETDVNSLPSAPELCMMEALAPLEDGGTYQVYRELPLKEVEGIRSDDPEVQAYIDNNARFDFVICRDDRVHAVIEVDGSFHRKADGAEHPGAAGCKDAERRKAVCKNDRLKNEAAATLGSAFYRDQFIRFPTDGTTHDEMDRVHAALKSAEEKGADLPRVLGGRGGRKTAAEQLPYYRKQMQLIRYLDKLLSDCRRDLNEELNKPGGYEESIKNVAFNDGQLPVYEHRGQAAFYFLKFANFNTLEYALMDQLALHMLKDETSVRVHSFGCGPAFDCLSGAYALNKLRDEMPDCPIKQLKYDGVDIAQWPYQIKPEEAEQDSVISALHLKDMTAFMSNENSSDVNLLFFPKVLSELTDETVDAFCKRLTSMTLTRPKIVLCISYRSFYAAKCDWQKAKKIVQALESNGYTAGKEVPPQFHEMDWAPYLNADCPPELDGYACYSAADAASGRAVWNSYAELRISESLRTYLRDTVRESCPAYIEYEKAHAQKNPEKHTDANQICQAAKCPDYGRCRTSARENLFASEGTGVCFQVLLFTKQ